MKTLLALTVAAALILTGHAARPVLLTTATRREATR